MAQLGVFAATTMQLATPIAMYATTSAGAAGPVPVYAAMAMQPPTPAPMYLATAPQAVGPSGMFDLMFEVLDGGDGDFGGVLQSLAAVGWPGVKIRDVLNDLPKVYEEHKKGLHCAAEAVCWRAGHYKLRNEQLRNLGTAGGLRSSDKSKARRSRWTSGGRGFFGRASSSESYGVSWRVLATATSL